jgi:hypothetical protein
MIENDFGNKILCASEKYSLWMVLKERLFLATTIRKKNKINLYNAKAQIPT